MPYASQAQAGYFHTHKAELERQGVNVQEWDDASRGLSLPKRAPKPGNRLHDMVRGSKGFGTH